VGGSRSLNLSLLRYEEKKLRGRRCATRTKSPSMLRVEAVRDDRESRGKGSYLMKFLMGSHRSVTIMKKGGEFYHTHQLRTQFQHELVKKRTSDSGKDRTKTLKRRGCLGKGKRGDIRLDWTRQFREGFEGEKLKNGLGGKMYIHQGVTLTIDNKRKRRRRNSGVPFADSFPEGKTHKEHRKRGLPRTS